MRRLLYCLLFAAALFPGVQRLANAGGLSDIIGIDVNIPAGTVTFGPPRPDRLPGVLQNLPKDTVTFLMNPFGSPLAFAIRQAKAQAHQHCQPIPPYVVTTLSGFFPPDVFPGVCWAIVAPGFSLAGFAIQDGGNAVVTFEDVTVFRSSQDAQDAVLWSHELTHVMQYRRLGVEGFAAIYAGAWDSLEQEARNSDQFVAARLQAQGTYWRTANGWNPYQQISTQQYAVSARQVVQTWHGVDLDAYCKSRGHRGVILAQNNAYGWKCAATNGTMLGIDMFDVCRWQYGGAWSRPVFTDFNNSNSWTCTPSQ